MAMTSKHAINAQMGDWDFFMSKPPPRGTSPSRKKKVKSHRVQPNIAMAQSCPNLATAGHPASGHNAAAGAAPAQQIARSGRPLSKSATLQHVKKIDSMQETLGRIDRSLHRNSLMQGAHLGMRLQEQTEKRRSTVGLPALTDLSLEVSENQALRSSSASRKSVTKLPSVQSPQSRILSAGEPMPPYRGAGAARRDSDELTGWAHRLLEDAQRQRDVQRRLKPVQSCRFAEELYEERPCTPFEDEWKAPIDESCLLSPKSRQRVVKRKLKTMASTRDMRVLSGLLMQSRRSSIPANMRLCRDPPERALTARPSVGSSLLERSQKSRKTLRRHTTKRNTVCYSVKSEVLVEQKVSKGRTNELLSLPEEKHAAEVQTIFRHVSEFGTVSHDALAQALHEIGHRHLSQIWINEIVAEECKGRFHLDIDDFLKFFDAYRNRFKAHLEKLFKVHDADSDGLLSSGDLSGLLASMDLLPLPGVVPQLIREVVRKDHGSAKVNFEAFVQIYDIVLDRSGFTKTEFQRIDSTFKHYISKGEDKLTLSQLRLTLMWLGLSHDIAAEAVERQREENLAQVCPMKDLMLLMHDFLEEEIDEINEACSNIDTELSGYVSVAQTAQVFERLGYVNASPETLDYLIEACKFQKKNAFLYEEVSVLVQKLRETHGFLPAEYMSVKEAYAMYNLLGQGIDVRELEVATRWLGYPSTLNQVRDIFEELDVNDKGTLQFQEFMLFVARYRDNDMALIRQVFKKYEGADTGLLPLSALRYAFLELSHMPSSGELIELVESVEEDATSVSFWGFVELVHRYRSDARERIRENEGFSDAEVRRLQFQFDRFDPEGFGCIRNEHLSALIEDLFPNVREQVNIHKRAKKLLEEVDENSDGELQFKEFLKLRRILENNADAERLRKERNMVTFTGFSKDEAREFRRLFDMCEHDGSHELSFEEFRKMINGIIPLKGEAVKELNVYLRAVDEDLNRRLDFPEFLYIMKKLLDANFQHIKEAAAEIAEKQKNQKALAGHRMTLTRRKSL